MPPDHSNRPYSIRRSRRARRILLRVQADGAVEVVAPPGVCESRLRAFVTEKAGWLESTRARVLAACRARDPAIDGPFPARLELRAIEHVVDLDWNFGSAGVLHFDGSKAERITIALPTPEPEAARTALLRILRSMAATQLETRLRHLADAHGISVGRVTWRNQRSRWGSCSASGNLSLNLRLLFVPPAAADYVLAHELAHRLHPNHSPAFWNQVERMDPAFRDGRAALKAAWPRLPDWLSG